MFFIDENTTFLLALHTSTFSGLLSWTCSRYVWSCFDVWGSSVYTPGRPENICTGALWSSSITHTTHAHMLSQASLMSCVGDLSPSVVKIQWSKCIKLPYICLRETNAVPVRG